MPIASKTSDEFKVTDADPDDDVVVTGCGLRIHGLPPELARTTNAALKMLRLLDDLIGLEGTCPRDEAEFYADMTGRTERDYMRLWTKIGQGLVTAEILDVEHDYYGDEGEDDKPEWAECAAAMSKGYPRLREMLDKFYTEFVGGDGSGARYWLLVAVHHFMSITPAAKLDAADANRAWFDAQENGGAREPIEPEQAGTANGNEKAKAGSRRRGS